MDFYPATLCDCVAQKWKMMSPVGCSDSLDKCHFLPVAIWWLPFHHFCRRCIRSSVWRHTFDSGCVALGWHVSDGMLARVPKVIIGMADEFCCPEAPKVVEKMALRMQRANLTDRHSVGGDWLADWLARGCLARNSCKFNEHSGSWEFQLSVCSEKVGCTNQLIAGALTTQFWLARPGCSVDFAQELKFKVRLLSWKSDSLLHKGMNVVPARSWSQAF